MRVGARTASAATLLVVVSLVAWRAGRLRPDRLVALDPWALLVIGALSAVCVVAIFRLWGLFRPADPAPMRVGPNSDFLTIPFELSPPLLALTYLVAFLQLGLFAFDQRAVARLRALPSELAMVGSDYCDAAEPDKAQKEDPLQHGCQLVLRAYALGYAKNLGNCAPKTEEEKKKQKGVAAPCDLRQLDEPYLHYAWRLLEKRVAWLSDALGPARTQHAFAQFRNESRHADMLLRVQADSVGAEARSSHHLFTNLPNPHAGMGEAFADKMGAVGCENMTGDGQPWKVTNQGPFSPSHALQHVVGQLLFSPVYQPHGGQCRELTIHWNAPDDVCARLAKDPEAVLAEFHALPDVREVISRQKRRIAVLKLRSEKGMQAADVPPPEHIVSFQCLIPSSAEAGADSALREHPLKLGQTQFVARELRVSKISADERGQLALYKSLAHLMSPGFAYSRILSLEAAGDEAADAAARKSLSEGGYLLSKLSTLREVDVFLGHDWLYARPDLLELYPYHLHLGNLINAFRERYQLERGRL